MVLNAFGIPGFANFMKSLKWPVVKAKATNIEDKSGAYPKFTGIGFQSQYLYSVDYEYNYIKYKSDLFTSRYQGDEVRLRINPEDPKEAIFSSDKNSFSIILVVSGVIMVMALIIRKA